MKRKLSFSTLLAICLCLSCISSAQAAYIDKTTTAGQYRIYYKSPSPASAEAIVIGVGTSMGRDAYDNLAAAITNTYGYIVVLMDHNPGNMVKTDATKYYNAAISLQSNLLGWMAGKGTTSIANWIFGGHSAGGQAAQNAVSANPGLADAIFSIDPYNCSSAGSVSVPALYWGFNVTTCFVTQEDAAEAAYYGSLVERVFYRAKKINTLGPCGYSPKYYHCSFTDNACPACTNCMYTPSSFHTDVAKTVNKFINAAFYGTWSKANVTVSTTTPIDLFVDGDQP
jgi:pimeloyl-ACP methyl ester carboxylesterase